MITLFYILIYLKGMAGDLMRKRIILKKRRHCNIHYHPENVDKLNDDLSKQNEKNWAHRAREKLLHLDKI